jgi:hypothetical protein
MKLYFKPCIFFILVSCSIFPIKVLANPENASEVDKEFWLELGVSKKISSKASVALWGDALNEIVPRLKNYDNYLEGSFKYQINPAFCVEALYRQEYSNEDGGTVVVEKRPQARAGYLFSLGNWSFRNRHQYEWRFIDDCAVKYRYRTDLRIKSPITFSKLNFVPYLQEEIFITDVKFKRSRCYLGMSGQLKQIYPAIYLVWQADRNTPDWDQKIGLGFSVEFKLY